MSFHGRSANGLAVVLASLFACSAAAAQPVQRTHGLDPQPQVTTASVAQATSAPADWCPNTTPGANQVDNGQYRYHAVYAHPADRASRLSAIGGELQQAAFGASALLEREYGRAVRFDIGTPCGVRQLDITSVRLPFTEAQLGALAAARGSVTFDAVAQALRDAGYGVAANNESRNELALRSLNFLVWLDGPAPARSCGQGTAMLDSSRLDTNLNNVGGKLAVIFRDGSDFCGADVVRHEIGHNLGALQPDAPNTSDGVHCNDAFEDTMCAFESPRIQNGAFNHLWFDYNNDDYWDPPNGQPLGWWTLNLSRFLCEDAECNRPGLSQADAASERTAERAATRTRPRRHARPRLRRHVRRGRRYVRLRLKARGSGRARIVVKCRRRIHPRRPHPRRIASRRVSLPAVVRVRTRCRSPRARVTDWRPPPQTPRRDQ